MNVGIEIFLDGRWQSAGVFFPDVNSIKRGIACSGTFEYDIDYTVEQLENRPNHRVGLNYPVSFALFRSPHWPPFLLDIMPAGAGRRVWLRRLDLADDAEADWELLRNGAGNATLRNTDNHGRNTAFLKREDGSVALSPLYDFAPMFLDPEGIPRSSRWEGDLEPVIGRPSWGLIVESLASVVTPGELRSVLLRDAEIVARLPDTMKKCGVEDQVIERVAHRCAEISGDLLQVKG